MPQMIVLGKREKSAKLGWALRLNRATARMSAAFDVDTFCEFRESALDEANASVQLFLAAERRDSIKRLNALAGKLDLDVQFTDEPEEEVEKPKKAAPKKAS